MAITYPISLPSTPAQVTITPVDTVAMSKSPFTSQQSVYAHPGEYWQIDIKTPNMDTEDGRPFVAALTSLRGMYGSILLGDPACKSPRGAVTGSPTVDGSGQTGFELAVQSLPVSTTGVFLAGDYIQIGTGSSAKLYMVMADADSDASGLATLDIWPRLRTSPTDGQAIIYNSPVGVFRRMSNEMPWTWDIPKITSVSLSFIEAL